MWLTNESWSCEKLSVSINVKIILQNRRLSQIINKECIELLIVVLRFPAPTNFKASGHQIWHQFECISEQCNCTGIWCQRGNFKPPKNKVCDLHFQIPRTLVRTQSSNRTCCRSHTCMQRTSGNFKSTKTFFVTVSFVGKLSKELST